MSHSESSQVQVSVLLADDAAIIRTTVKRFLEIEPLINVLGEAVSFRQAISMANTLKPDVVLLDLHMPDDREFDAPFLKSQFLCSGARVLAMSLYEDEETKVLAESLGAVTLLDKSKLHADLIPALLRQHQPV